VSNSTSPPTLYVIAGCNGAGKTTSAKEVLPREVPRLHFLNADESARADIQRRFRRRLAILLDAVCRSHPAAPLRLRPP
jgi:adenylate kinase family enzyme